MCMYNPVYNTPLSFIDEQGVETKIVLYRDWEGGQKSNKFRKYI